MTLQDLEKLLNEATGDRFNESDELGVAIYETLGICSYIPDEGDPTKSLDAAIALAERVLPSSKEDGRVWLQILHDAVIATLSKPGGTKDDLTRFVCVFAVRALIAKEGKQ